MHPEITIAWGDRASAGKLVTWAQRHLNLTFKAASRPKDTSGFVVLPRRWVVERSLAWIMHAQPACPGLRTARPALREPNHVGGDHADDPPTDPEQEEPGRPAHRAGHMNPAEALSLLSGHDYPGPPPARAQPGRSAVPHPSSGAEAGPPTQCTRVTRPTRAASRGHGARQRPSRSSAPPHDASGARQDSGHGLARRMDLDPHVDRQVLHQVQPEAAPPGRVHRQKPRRQGAGLVHRRRPRAGLQLFRTGQQRLEKVALKRPETYLPQRPRRSFTSPLPLAGETFSSDEDVPPRLPGRLSDEGAADPQWVSLPVPAVPYPARQRAANWGWHGDRVPAAPARSGADARVCGVRRG